MSVDPWAVLGDLEHRSADEIGAALDAIESDRELDAFTLSMVRSLFRWWLLSVVGIAAFVALLAWQGAWYLMPGPVAGLASSSFAVGLLVGRRWK